ncbi:hypothetical protein [Endothiovibrio diazotrophicus]
MDVPMEISEDELRNAAKLRIARLFNVAPENISLDDIFGKDIHTSFVSNWKPNELDIIYDDICDIVDKKTWKELGSGRIKIRTVGDYCDLMVSSYKSNKKNVTEILFDYEKEENNRLKNNVTVILIAASVIGLIVALLFVLN